MEMKWGERGKESKRDGVGCVGMAWPLSNTHTHTLTLTHTISNTQTWPGTRPGFIQMGYYSDVQLYSKGSSTDNTVRSTKGHHQPMPRGQPGQFYHRCHQIEGFL